MTKVESYEDLLVWQKAHKLVLKTYEVTKSFPAKEQFGLVLQLWRSLVSVPANIAEGFNRYHLKEYLQFLNIAKGSLGEGEYYIRLAKDLGYISEDEFQSLYKHCNEVGRMLSGLLKSLKKCNCE